ncbi:MAG TPA: PhnD/SsuA/transferrin family substrate-binding protein [Burkholderiales bacterium]|nr:PhnD/SsuA/transferrin family substrate-binding protein [Burkholderiales bacterium]
MTKAVAPVHPIWIPFLLCAVTLAASASAFAQKAGAKGDQAQLIFAINEGGSGNLDATEIFLRWEDFTKIAERALGIRLTMVAVRDIQLLQRSVETGAYALVLSRPADVLAQAVRDYGYNPVVVSREPAHALFIVNKDSPLKTIADVRGKRIVTPDRYAYMWRIANAMLRDNKITMAREQVKAMRDQAAIAWSMENNFFDVGVVASFSPAGRTWEKKGGRVIAISPEVPNTPMIASRKISPAQVAKLRDTLVALDSTEDGKAVLKRINIAAFKPASPQVFIDLLNWLGPLEPIAE